MVDSNFNESDLFMRIMILNSLYYPYRVGGAEISVQLLAEQLVKLENEVKVITLHDKKEIKTDFVNGVEVTYLPLKNIYWGFPNTTTSKFKKAIWHFIDCYNFEMKKMVSVQIAQFKPDIVHTNNICGFSVSAWDAVKKAKVKLVHTSRDY
ncbi:glycosyltransferase, partial [Klebsiella pneumoniae]